MRLLQDFKGWHGEIVVGVFEVFLGVFVWRPGWEGAKSPKISGALKLTPFYRDSIENPRQLLNAASTCSLRVPVSHSSRPFP